MNTRPVSAAAELAQSIYIHLPFCEQRCTFCDFFTITDADQGRQRTRQWLDLIAREMQLWIAEGQLSPSFPLKSIYFGGGTPSLAPPDAIGNLIRIARSELVFAPEIEITLEMQPGTATDEALAQFGQVGINRFSVGVQSFNSRILEMTGRKHTCDDSRAMLHALTRLNLPTSVDLIAAWPGQTIEEWRRDMAEAMSFNAQHYSVYELTFKPGTPMHLQFRTGELTPATEELRIEMFEETERLLSLRGYEHYEISNYAKPGARSRHNANYWQLGNYAGLGAGAHSFIFPHRYINANNARDYQQAVSNGKLFRRISNSSDPIIFLLENLQLALRLTEGVNLDDFSQRFGTDIRSIRSRKLADLVEAGYAELTNAQLKLTPAGRMRIDSISEYLLT